MSSTKSRRFGVRFDASGRPWYSYVRCASQQQSVTAFSSQDDAYDLAVIGGGIMGAWVANDAAHRGLRVILLEQDDLAGGTSSRTSKLIHGGLRYLEQFAFRLVAESERERSVWLRIAPHLVRPLPFLLPLYRRASRPPWMVRLGMTLYDALSLYRNVEPHRMLSAAEAQGLEPALQGTELTGAAHFYDAQMDDARTCLEVALSARAASARLETSARVDGLIRKDGLVSGVRVGDRDISARVVVNAAGPWLDRVSAMGGGPAHRIRMTRGAHLVVRPLLRTHALVLSATRDGRVFFVIPWRGLTLIGTTDLDYEGDPAAVTCSEEERRYLLEETQRAVPSVRITDRDVVAEFAGVRPLVFEAGRSASAVGREDVIAEETNGVIAIAGGKFTTGRAVAERVVDRVAARLNRGDVPRCRTATTPLIGGHPIPVEERHAWQAQAQSLGLDGTQFDALIAMYGSRCDELMALIAKRGLGGRLHPELPWVGAQVDFAVEQELARSVDDVLRRRLPIALGPYRHDESIIRNVAERMGALLNWDAATRDDHIARYTSPSSTIPTRARGGTRR
jgi:glycerol-3-phosphate dehydrogenase